MTLCDWPSVGTAGTPSLQTRFGASGVTRCHSGGVGVQVREPPFSLLPSPVCLDVGDGRGGVLRVTGLGRGVWGVSAVRGPCEGPAGAPAGGGQGVGRVRTQRGCALGFSGDEFHRRPGRC